MRDDMREGARDGARDDNVGGGGRVGFGGAEQHR
jgi:hypothetical protein